MEFNNETIRIAVELYVKNEKEGEEKYGHINTWNVSGVTDMNFMFYMDDDTSSFNHPLSNWNVSNVTDMSHMFYDASSFNQSLSNWNVSNVTDMNNMFHGAPLFNQPLDDWDVSKVTNMNFMFGNAKAFNQPLNNWNVSNVTNMERMFGFASSFNQPLNNWNVSNVTYIWSMFNSTTIGKMLKKHNLTNKQFFESPTNKKVYHELFVWPRKKDYVTFLVNNQYLPLNKHQEKHEYHPLFDNPDMSKYIACYL